MRKSLVLTSAFIFALIPVIGSATGKIRICHKEKTITVSESAVRKHLDHGDTIGPCPQSEAEVSEPEVPEPEPHDFRPNHRFLPNTGDNDFDVFLIEINRIAVGRLDDYISDLSDAFNIPRKKVVYLIYNERMQPADVFMILQTARLSGRPHLKLLPKFKRHRREGWRAVVISLGIKPGSRMFLLLKEDIPRIIWHYVVRGEERSRWKKGSRRKKGSVPEPEPHDFRPNHRFLPNTGDNDFDVFLIEINRIAVGRLDDYISDLSDAFNIPRKKVVYLIYNERMQPADVFMILQTARLSGQPHLKLLPKFKRHRREGWRAVVISLGLKPGSRMFLLLKEDIPRVIWHYVVRGEERPRWKKGSKRKKSSKRKKGSKHKKGKKGSKGRK